MFQRVCTQEVGRVGTNTISPTGGSQRLLAGGWRPTASASFLSTLKGLQFKGEKVHAHTHFHKAQTDCRMVVPSGTRVRQ